MQKKKRSLNQFRSQQLSRRQRQVIELVTDGLKNREIAVELGVRVDDVRKDLGFIYHELGVKNRVELVLSYVAAMQKDGV